MFLINLLKACQRFEAGKSNTHWMTQILALIGNSYILLLNYIYSIKVNYVYDNRSTLIIIVVVQFVVYVIYFISSYVSRQKLKSGRIEWFTYNLMSISIQVLPSFFLFRYGLYISSDFQTVGGIILFGIALIIQLILMFTLLTKISPAHISNQQSFTPITAQMLHLYHVNMAMLLLLRLFNIDSTYLTVLQTLLVPHYPLFADYASNTFNVVILSFMLSLNMFLGKYVIRIYVPIIISLVLTLFNVIIHSVKVVNNNENYTTEFLLLSFLQTGYIGNIQDKNLHESIKTKLSIVFEKINKKLSFEEFQNSELSIQVNQIMLQSHIQNIKYIRTQFLHFMLTISEMRVLRLLQRRNKIQKDQIKLTQDCYLYKVNTKNSIDIQLFILTNQTVNNLYFKYVNNSISSFQLAYLRQILIQYVNRVNQVKLIALGLQNETIETRMKIKNKSEKEIINIQQQLDQQFSSYVNKTISKKTFKQQVAQLSQQQKQLKQSLDNEIQLKITESSLQIYKNIDDKRIKNIIKHSRKAYYNFINGIQRQNLVFFCYWFNNLKLNELTLQSQEIEQFIAYKTSLSQSIWPFFYYIIKLDMKKQKELMIRYVKNKYNSDNNIDVQLKMIKQLTLSSIFMQLVLPFIKTKTIFKQTKNTDQNQTNNKQIIYGPHGLCDDEQELQITQNDQSQNIPKSEMQQNYYLNQQMNNIQCFKDQITELENSYLLQNNNVKEQTITQFDLTNNEQFVRIFNALKQIKNDNYYQEAVDQQQKPVPGQHFIIQGIGINNLNVFNLIFIKDLYDTSTFSQSSEMKINSQTLYTKYYEDFSVLVLGFWNFQQYMNYNEPFFKIELFSLDKIYQKYQEFNKAFQQLSKKQLDYDVLCAYYAFIYYFNHNPKKLRELKYKIYTIQKFYSIDKMKKNNYLISQQSISRTTTEFDFSMGNFSEYTVDKQISVFSGFNKSSQGNENDEEDKTDQNDRQIEDFKIKQKIHSNNFINYLKQRSQKNRKLNLFVNIVYFVIILSAVLLSLMIYLFQLQDIYAFNQEYQQKVQNSNTIIKLLTQRLDISPNQKYERKEMVNEMIQSIYQNQQKNKFRISSVNNPLTQNTYTVAQIQDDINPQQYLMQHAVNNENLVSNLILNQLNNEFDNQELNNGSAINYLQLNDLDIVRNQFTDIKLYLQRIRSQLQYWERKYLLYINVLVIIILIFLEVQQLNFAITKAKQVLNSFKYSVKNDLTNSLNYFKKICQHQLKIITKQNKSQHSSKKTMMNSQSNLSQNSGQQHQLSSKDSYNSLKDRENDSPNVNYMINKTIDVQLDKMQKLFIKNRIFGIFMSRKKQFKTIQYQLLLNESQLSSKKRMQLKNQLKRIDTKFNPNLFIIINLVIFFIIYFMFECTKENNRALNNFHQFNNMRLQQHVSQQDFLSRFAQFINLQYQLIEKRQSSIMESLQLFYVENNFVSEAKDIFYQYQNPSNDTIQTNFISQFIFTAKTFITDILSPVQWTINSYQRKYQLNQIDNDVNGHLISAIQNINHFLTISRILFYHGTDNSVRVDYNYNINHDIINKLKIEAFSNESMTAKCKQLQPLYTNLSNDEHNAKQNNIDKSLCILFSQNMIDNAKVILNYTKHLATYNDQIINKSFVQILMNNKEQFTNINDMKPQIQSQCILGVIVLIIILVVQVSMIKQIGFTITSNTKQKAVLNHISGLLLIVINVMVMVFVVYKNANTISSIQTINQYIEKQKELYESKLQIIQYDYYLNSILLKNDQFIGGQTYNYVTSLLPVLNSFQTVLIQQNYKELLPLNQYANPFSIDSTNYESLSQFLGNATMYDTVKGLELQKLLIQAYKEINSQVLANMDQFSDGVLTYLYLIFLFHLAVELLMANKWTQHFNVLTNQKTYSGENILRQIQKLGRDVLHNSPEINQINLNKQFKSKSIDNRLYFSYVPIILICVLQIALYFIQVDINQQYNQVVKPTHKQLGLLAEKLVFHDKKLQIILNKTLACNKDNRCIKRQYADQQIQYRYLSENIKTMKMMIVQIQRNDQEQYPYGGYINYLSNYQMYNSLTYRGSVNQMIYNINQQSWNESLLRYNYVEGALNYFKIDFDKIVVYQDGKNVSITPQVLKNTFDMALLHSEHCHIKILSDSIQQMDCKNFQKDLQLIYSIFQQFEQQVNQEVRIYVPVVVICVVFEILVIIFVTLSRLYGIDSFLKTRLKLFQNMALKSMQ